MKLESTQDILNKLMSNTSLNQQQQRELSSRVNSRQLTRKDQRQAERNLRYSSDSRQVYARDYNYNPSMFGSRSSYFSRKKTLDQMLAENPELYEVEKMPVKNLKAISRDKMKDELALAMEYNGKKNIPKILTKPRKKNAPAANSQQKTQKSADDIRFEECLREVEERMEWLNEMRNAGEADKYEAMIKGQCALLIKEMREIDKRKAQKEEKRLKS